MKLKKIITGLFFILLLTLVYADHIWLPSPLPEDELPGPFVPEDEFVDSDGDGTPDVSWADKGYPDWYSDNLETCQYFVPESADMINYNAPSWCAEKIGICEWPYAWSGRHKTVSDVNCFVCSCSKPQNGCESPPCSPESCKEEYPEMPGIYECFIRNGDVHEGCFSGPSCIGGCSCGNPTQVIRDCAFCGDGYWKQNIDCLIPSGRDWGYCMEESLPLCTENDGTCSECYIDSGEFEGICLDNADNLIRCSSDDDCPVLEECDPACLSPDDPVCNDPDHEDYYKCSCGEGYNPDCSDDCLLPAEEIPVSTCLGKGELYVYRGTNMMQRPISISFDVNGSRDELLIFGRTSKEYFNVEINDILVDHENDIVLKAFGDDPFDVWIYSITLPVNPDTSNSITIKPRNSGPEWNARAIQGYLAQNTEEPVYLIDTLNIRYTGDTWIGSNEFYLTPELYNFVYFDKYTLYNDGGIDERILTARVYDPDDNLILEQSTDKPVAPSPAPEDVQGVVAGDYFEVTRDNIGIYELTVESDDSVYWVYVDCPQPSCQWCGDGILNGKETCDYSVEDGVDSNEDGIPDNKCELDGVLYDCDTDCQCDCRSKEWCGDGILNGEESCDFNAGYPDNICVIDGEEYPCDNHCLCGCRTNEWCGDGILNGKEDCDYNANSPDNQCPDGTECDENCLCTGIEPYCGDGIVQDGEVCDYNAPYPGNRCFSDGQEYDCDLDCTCGCKEPSCGDGIVSDGEKCDPEAPYPGNKCFIDGEEYDCDVETCECETNCNEQPSCGNGQWDGEDIDNECEYTLCDPVACSESDVYQNELCRACNAQITHCWDSEAPVEDACRLLSEWQGPEHYYCEDGGECQSNCECMTPDECFYCG
ncbi:hypothetical protein GF327_08155, partial [Candidatus Woesearchaeota archaeon]|nr:hypothetical protein [Candidatus Woesearchaeota archaeon]